MKGFEDPIGQAWKKLRPCGFRVLVICCLELDVRILIKQEK